MKNNNCGKCTKENGCSCKNEKSVYNKKTMKTKTTTVTTTTTTETVTSSEQKTIYDFFVLDRSGSMSTILQSTIDGFNEYINTSKITSKETGVKCLASVLLFDHEFIMLHDNVDINSMEPLTTSTFIPRGNTALNDAIAMAISSLKAKLTGKESSDNVDVTITVFTDGHENASKEYSGFGNPELAKLIKDVQDNFKWTVAFVGAGSAQAINNVSASLNIVNCSSYSANLADSKRMFADLSSVRSVKSCSYAATGMKSNEGYFSPTTPVVE